MDPKRKALLIFLFLATVVVGVAAVYIGLQLQDQPDVTPDDTSAAPAACCENAGGPCDAGTSCGGFDLQQACNAGRGWCWCAQTNNKCPEDPGQTLETFCGTSNWDGNVTYTCPSGQVISSAPTAFRDCGVCGGPTSPPNTNTPTPTPRKAICGESCNTNADCAPSTGGARVICQNRRCVNENCPNNTTPGTICSCGNTASCGEPCGKNTLPLCGDGISECGFIGPGITQCSESQRNPWNQYCLPRNPANGYTRQRCTTIAAWHLFAPNGQAVTTQAQVREACVPYTPTPTPTPTYQIADCGDPCDPAQGSSACVVGHTCTDVNGTNQCVLNQCVTNPALCEADRCSLLNEVPLTKSARTICSDSNTPANQIAVFTIVAQNDQAVARTFTIRDTLDSRITDSMVVQASLTNGGTVSGGVITWQNLQVPANGTLTLSYQVALTGNLTNETLSNSVLLLENGVERGQDSIQYTPGLLPCTALISDEVDRILIAAALILLGFSMYTFKVHYQIGDLLNPEGAYWKSKHKAKAAKFGEKISKTIDGR
ncbi:MAG: hypothetical protein QY330_04620 [Candidatus Dojkabacteria bacterium]|nr:MAG: hypothetical protein QY330_04620 [Candidatus Dojkabacteria bacterium]